MVDFATAGDLSPENMHHKILLYGNSGAGKSWASAGSGGSDVFILATERNALQSIKHSNPKARVLYTGEIGGVREFIGAAISGELHKQGARVLVIDSLTECQRLLKDEILAGKAGNEFGIQDWGTLTEKMRRMLRTIRDLPYHVICTALSQSEIEESTGMRHVAPAFEGKKLPNEVAQYFNVVGYCYKQENVNGEGKRVVEHKIMVDGSSRFVVKPCHPLNGIMRPDLQMWIGALNSGEIPEQPEAPAGE